MSLGKAALTGAYLAGGAMIFQGQSWDNTANILGMSVPGPLALAGAGAASSLVTDIGRTMILPHLPLSDMFGSIEGAALGVGLSGGAAMLITSSMGAAAEKGTSGFLLGAGSYMLADYTAPMLFGGGGGSTVLFG